VRIPQHNPAVFYYDAADGRLEATLSVKGFVLLVVVPLVVLGLLVWWASRARSDE
jgi:hypothetical protein